MSHNNRRRWKSDRVDTLRRLLSAGATPLRVADYLGTSEGAVIWQMDLLGLRVLDLDVVDVGVPEINPPSAAMLRLAQFDPVVRRAVDQRLGLGAVSLESE